MKRYLLPIVLVAVLAGCKSAPTVGVLTEPTPASSNVPGKEFPKVYPDLRAEFQIVAPEAQSVAVDCGKVYPLTKGENGTAEEEEIDRDGGDGQGCHGASLDGLQGGDTVDTLNLHGDEAASSVQTGT